MARFRARETAMYVLVLTVTSIATIWALKLWNATPSIPLHYWGDAAQIMGYVDSLIETGWYETQPNLGAPTGQVFHDYPLADNLHLMIMSALARVTPQFGVVLNTYFLAGFPLAALGATWFGRSVGLNRWFAGSVGVLFALAPYHFFRNEAHLFLASYWPVPLCFVLVARVLTGRGLWNRRGVRSARTLGGYLTGQNVATLLILVLLGTATQYYAVFDIVIFMLAGVLAAMRTGSWRALVGPAIASGITGVALFLNMLPDFLYQWEHGQNYLTPLRAAVESEVYALKLVMMLLPAPGHRLPLFREITASYESQFGASTMAALGLVGSLGFLAMLVAMTFFLARSLRRNRPVPFDPIRSSILQSLATIATWLFLLCTTGGFAVFVALLVTDKIRGWDRISIYLTLMGLVSAALLLHRLAGAIQRRFQMRRKLIAPLLALFVTALGVWDQTGPAVVPPYELAKQTFLEDQAYGSSLERQLPDRAMILQLPFQPFPEGPRIYNYMGPYDHVRPSLFTTTLRWSYGAVYGRADADWQDILTRNPTEVVAVQAASAGFSGVSVYRSAYADHAADVEASLARVTGSVPLVSTQGTYSYWDLTSLRDSLIEQFGSAAVDALGHDTVRTVVPYGVGSDFTVTLIPEGYTWWSHSGAGDFVLDSNLERPRDVSIEIRASLFAGESLTISLPDGSERRFSAEQMDAGQVIRTSVEPGRSVLRLVASNGTFLVTSMDVTPEPSTSQEMLEYLESLRAPAEPVT